MEGKEREEEIKDNNIIPEEDSNTSTPDATPGQENEPEENPSIENIIEENNSKDQEEEKEEEEEEKKEKGKRKNKEKKHKTKNILKSFWSVIKTIFMGRILSIDFIIRYWKTILVFLFVSLFYISNRYVCQQTAAHIKKVEREIHEIRYKSLDMFTRLKSIQHEDSIIKNIERFDLNLELPEQPPYIIKQNGKE